MASKSQPIEKCAQAGALAMRFFIAMIHAFLKPGFALYVTKEVIFHIYFFRRGLPYKIFPYGDLITAHVLSAWGDNGIRSYSRGL